MSIFSGQSSVASILDDPAVSSGSHSAGTPKPAVSPAPDRQAWEKELDRAAFVEAARKHEAALAASTDGQSQVSGRAALKDMGSGFPRNDGR
mgnify:CR=1 FL=1